MRRYLTGVFLTAGIYLAVHFSVCLYVPAPIPAEYWMGESISLKRTMAEAVPSPRVLFLGGSSTLFGIDAARVGNSLGIPALNLGMHAGMRLERVLDVGNETARRGDVVVLALEKVYYGCDRGPWSRWQLRNSLAWDRAYFGRLPLGERVRAVFSGGGPALMFEILGEKIGANLEPEAYSERLRALESPQALWSIYRSGKLRTGDFSYSAFNLDGNGDMLNTVGPPYAGPGVPADEPGAVCPAVREQLAGFVEGMRGRGVRVIFAHTPYLVDSEPAPGWKAAEAAFSGDIASLGAKLLDRREELFLPRDSFLNTPTHLNAAGRRRRTDILIADLRKIGIGESTPGRLQPAKVPSGPE
jgi:hypothetical protein